MRFRGVTPYFTTRRLALTEAGVRYLQRAEKILDDLREADDEAGSARWIGVDDDD